MTKIYETIVNKWKKLDFLLRFDVICCLNNPISQSGEDYIFNSWEKEKSWRDETFLFLREKKIKLW
jgi:hypothetical protein